MDIGSKTECLEIIFLVLRISEVRSLVPDLRILCLQVVQQLDQQCQIEPCFTQLVWQKLEEQNQEFFRAYYTRLKLKDQIVLFNHLLDEQVKMFHRMPQRAAPAVGGEQY